MKHAPINELPTKLRSAFEKAEAVWIYQLQGKRVSKFSSASYSLAIDPYANIAAAISRDAKRARTRGIQLNLAEHSAASQIMTYNRVQASATKRTRHAEQMNSF